jgi:electron transport complex protein RnfD
MLHVIIALAPVSLFGIFIYGLQALAVILVSVAAAVAGETVFRLVLRREARAGDLSAVVSGLLLALVLPPSTPLWMAALGAVFAVIIAKEFFGGLGANVFNPALTGRAFLLMSFPAAITSWTAPRGISGASVSNALSAASGALDAVSTATPLAIIKTGGTIADIGRSFAALGLAPSADYLDTLKVLFVGNHAGTIGESSILLILIGAFYLLINKVIDWRAPLAMAVSAFVLSFVLGLDPVVAILGGGICFGAVFMATDYVTSPLTAAGKLLFGAGAGIITVLIRKWGNYPEGVTFGILIMNGVTPFLNRLLQKKYGYVPKVKPAAAPAPKEAAK